ncbi:hypothetical protein K491DRAFT_761563 [Lophiostoma macrostomum CBS 122681]|uniref:Secreted protein n=1 Tax=Lophiostoma macrostomum CBS 122681 TaxID=1314788 RepID=A0A6A6SX08_9PLEO|nr:hypothetical protein K491DRAFT_761563 [Lophiostoma macrostomum CBS 122681]
MMLVMCVVRLPRLGTLWLTLEAEAVIQRVCHQIQHASKFPFVRKCIPTFELRSFDSKSVPCRAKPPTSLPKLLPSSGLPRRI